MKYEKEPLTYQFMLSLKRARRLQIVCSITHIKNREIMWEKTGKKCFLSEGVVLYTGRGIDG